MNRGVFLAERPKSLALAAETTLHSACDCGVRLHAARIRVSKTLLYSGHESRLFRELVEHFRGQQDACRLAVLGNYYGRTSLTCLAQPLRRLGLELAYWNKVLGDPYAPDGSSHRSKYGPISDPCPDPGTRL